MRAGKIALLAVFLYLLFFVLGCISIPIPSEIPIPKFPIFSPFF